MSRKINNLVPSAFTLLNLFFGFFAIISAIQEKYVTASWMIIIAGIWDALDGKVARKTQSYSEFGIQLDSIVDMVSFGVAPAVLVYEVFFYKLGPSGIVLSFLPMMFGAIRLARFNVTLDGFEKESFSGLPIPAMAATLSTYVIFNYDIWEGLKFGPLLIPLVVFLCILMVSNVEYEGVPKFSFKENKKNSVLFILVLLAVAVAVVFRERMLFPMAFGFVLFYFIRSLVLGFKEDEEDEELFDISIPD
ncbi:CDP-diacylglycerol--serine O-phosphatidyltransferase [candidate division KSB1 bacterium]|nr:CDP-diacylglycerol--serine O-phosphatidyltransferase [candidate division KSB1 bacterium]NIR70148.1 CDP-diacylglycerol--serine O-phosphatidyltransferase [candidate division KSB1 bacterium]NIS28060.1 CDP-diacylglycerol--serine O-phosphatidyltransferase [candidate division KSB1 bacterium]NIT74929.1 CDP-diacylglycerol--serine O-phosphatidyltransferase [candidate division KSB1 bacterium]NIU28713.1 CDP-diacylglycerol--serine O-phosphatidyltransferase [candidate division KSB1 bacterium]